MDAAYLHLTVNHFPIVLTTVGALAALLAMVSGRRVVWLYACATLTLAGLSAPLAFFTGREAEETVEHSWFVTREAIDAHEEAGEWALWVLLAMGVVSLYAWMRRLRAPDVVRLPRWLQALVVLLALVGAATVGRTAWLGGYVVHKAAALQGTAPPGSATTPEPAPR